MLLLIYAHINSTKIIFTYAILSSLLFIIGFLIGTFIDNSFHYLYEYLISYYKDKNNEILIILSILNIYVIFFILNFLIINLKNSKYNNLIFTIQIGIMGSITFLFKLKFFCNNILVGNESEQRIVGIEQDLKRGPKPKIITAHDVIIEKKKPGKTPTQNEKHTINRHLL
jgi:hypothetical protein